MIVPPPTVAISSQHTQNTLAGVYLSHTHHWVKFGMIKVDTIHSGDRFPIQNTGFQQIFSLLGSSARYDMI
jgi:hypothetical protein